MQKFKLMTLAILLGMSAVFSTTSIAQTKHNPFSVAVMGGKTDYMGDYGNTSFKTEQAFNWNLGGRIGMYINPSFDAELRGGYTNFSHIASKANPETVNFTSDGWNLSLMANYKFDNGYILPEDFVVGPYISYGLGFAQHLTKTPENEFYVNDLNIPLGVGVDVRLTDNLELFWESTFNILTSDLADEIVNKAPDVLVMHQLGVKVNFGPSRDIDNDGVLNYKDKCPKQNGFVANNGCPIDIVDRDFDGIIDAEDACPYMKGAATANGCPDTDLDGIRNANDACPLAAGEAMHMGCPDTDKDEVYDNVDRCPTVKGVLANLGCPVVIPDTDGDGINDEKDLCPYMVGGVQNDGCPKIQVDIIATFEASINDIHFDYNKAKIKKKWYNRLDKVVEVLKEEKHINMVIEGYADKTGDNDYNKQLSKKRAEAVKEYLVNKGIGFDRIQTLALGEKFPIATNQTKIGRAENRRVDFSLYYKR